jgi:type I restriction enzyme R subunit
VPADLLQLLRKALLAPLMKRAELVMADDEEWITSGATSIVLSPPALELK